MRNRTISISKALRQTAVGIPFYWRSNTLVRSDSAKTPIKRYETMLIIRPDIIDEERDRLLAKFQAFLTNEGAVNIDCAVKGRQRMAYPIGDYRDGIYVLYQFAAAGSVAKTVQHMLANPDVETQGNIIRW